MANCPTVSSPIAPNASLAGCSEIETVFIPWLMDHVQESAGQQLMARTLLDGECKGGEGRGGLLGTVMWRNDTALCAMSVVHTT